jgi:hypothetical protein
MPIGAMSHADEPGEGNINVPGTFFGLWEAQKNFTISRLFPPSKFFAMKIPSVIFAIVVLILVETGFAQSFQNLNFEAANIPGSTPIGSTVPISAGLPGWSGYIGGVQQTVAYYDISALDTSRISIIDHGWSSFPEFGVNEGNYTALLAAGIFGGPPADTTLSQTGLVPSGTQSLLFRAFFEGLPGSFAATLGGQTLSLTPLGSGTDYTLYGANINSWANQTAELAFTVFAQQPHQANFCLSLDSIQFPTQSIPEPSGLAFLGIGALLLGLIRRRNSSR